MSTVTDWNFFNTNVQSGLLEGRYLNAASTLLASGPPRLSAAMGATTGNLSANIAYPLGVLQSVGVGIGAQITRVWEIGSERSYYITGRTAGTLALGSIIYHGPNLLRKLWSYLDVSPEFTGGEQLYPNQSNANLNTSRGPYSKQTYKVAPGYNNFWIELASDVFKQPVGVLIYMKDSNDAAVGAFYFEYSLVGNYGWNTDAGATIMSENAAMVYERIVPIDIDSVPLIKDSNSLTESGIVGANVIGSAAGPVAV